MDNVVLSVAEPERLLYTELMQLMEEECVNEYSQKIRNLVGDELSIEKAEKVLFGQLIASANNEDGETADSVIRDFENDKRRWQFARYLILSCPTDKVEERQRLLEVNVFIKNMNLSPDRYITMKIESDKQLYKSIKDFLCDNASFEYHLNIVLLGHGEQKISWWLQLFNYLKILNRGKVESIENGHLAQFVDNCLLALSKNSGERRKGCVHLCLFYCYAQYTTFSVKSKDFFLVLYRSGATDPQSDRALALGHRGKKFGEPPLTDPEGLLSSRSRALSWLEEEVKRAMAGERYSILPVSRTLSQRFWSWAGNFIPG